MRRPGGGPRVRPITSAGLSLEARPHKRAARSDCRCNASVSSLRATNQGWTRNGWVADRLGVTQPFPAASRPGRVMPRPPDWRSAAIDSRVRGIALNRARDGSLSVLRLGPDRDRRGPAVDLVAVFTAQLCVYTAGTAPASALKDDRRALDYWLYRVSEKLPLLSGEATHWSGRNVPTWKQVGLRGDR